MDTPVPFFTEQGEGVGVVCLHSNASTSSQWRKLADVLASRFHVIAVDGYGAGKSPPWPGPGPLRLQEEVRLLEPALQRAGDRFHLVGHSYGAAVALMAALTFPQRVLSLVLYEPTLFHLVVRGDPMDSPAEGIWRAASEAADAVARGDSRLGAKRFIDFWMGSGAWDAMPQNRQAAVAASVASVKAWRDALFDATLPRSSLGSLQVPVWLMTGENSPLSSSSVSRVLQDMLPQVTAVAQRGLGHMGPITHPDLVNSQIASFLAEGQS